MIKILNYRNFQTVCYSLPLIVGEVVGIEDSELQLLCSEDPKITWWPVVKGNFKILVSLVPGRNCFKIKCRSFTKVFNLIYQPLSFKCFVRLVYITCCDSDTFQAPCDEDSSVVSACDRICLGARMLQSFTAAKLQDHGLQPKTFCLEEMNGKPICHVYKSSLHLEEALKMSDTELWDYFAIKLMNSKLRVGDDCKFLAILSFTRYISDSMEPPITFKEIKNRTKAYVALGAGGLALLGSACLHTWPQALQEVPWRFADDRKVDNMKFMDDSGFRESFWGCYATSLGAVIHELGHIFNLGHTNTGIMARGFEDIHKHFITDLFYCSHPFQKKHNPYFQEHIHEKNSCVRVTPSANILWKPTMQVLEAPPLNNQSKYCPSSRENQQRPPDSRSKPPWRTPDPPENDGFYKNGNGAFWCRSSALILFYHRWFNDFQTDEDSGKISFNGTLITASNGIRVVEFRDEENLEFHHLEYLDGNGASEVDIAVEVSQFLSSIKIINLFVLDSVGGINQKSFPAEELCTRK